MILLFLSGLLWIGFGFTGYGWLHGLGFGVMVWGLWFKAKSYG